MRQKIISDPLINQYTLITLNDDGSITSEELTAEEATQWEAENKF